MPESLAGIQRRCMSKRYLITPTGTFRAAALLLALAGFVVAQPLPNKTANFVWGQTTNFTTNVPNKGGLHQGKPLFPVGVAVDSDGSVYIVDQGNHRVLHYPKGSDQADFVYGQNSNCSERYDQPGHRVKPEPSSPSGFGR